MTSSSGDSGPQPTRAALLSERPLLVFLGAAVVQVGFLYGISQLGSPSRYLGIPGAATALFGVVAAILAGPLVGVAVALVGGVAFLAFITNFAQKVTIPTIVASVALWTLAALVAGLGAEAVRRRGLRREALLAEALTDAVSARRGIERIVELAPTFYRVKDHRDLPKSICQAAKDTFSSLSCSIYRAAADSLVLVDRVPETELLQPGVPLAPEDSPGLREALRSNTPTFQPDVAEEGRSPQGKALAARLGIRSSLRVPIHLSEHSAYLLVLNWDEPRSSIDPTLVALVRRFSDQAALALERAEVEALHTRLEEGLLARSHDSYPRLKVAVRYWPGDQHLGVGGDFVDYLPDEPRGLSFVIGDVSGHGPDAAALGATLRSGWRVLALARVGLEEMLDHLNVLLFSERTSDNVYCTMLVGQVDTGNRLLRVANAGHPPPILLAKEAELLRIRPVLPLGCERKPRSQPSELSLPESWSLLLFTDGLYEGSISPGSPERFGIDRLVIRLGQEAPGPMPETVLDQILAEVKTAHGKSLPDDLAILFLSTPHGGESASKPSLDKHRGTPGFLEAPTFERMGP